MKTARRSTSNRVEAYVASVLDGTLPSCRMVVLACERYRRDQERDDIYMDWPAVNKVVRFAGILNADHGETCQILGHAEEGSRRGERRVDAGGHI